MAERRGGGPPAVIVGLDTIVGLQTARVLSRSGVTVIGIADDPKHYCARTNTVERVIPAPTSGAALLDALDGLGRRLPDGTPLLPCRDPSMRTISAARDELGPFRTLLPDHDVVLALSDKARFAGVAAELRLRVPAAVTIGPGDDPVAATEGLRHPLIVKPVFRDERWEQRSGAKAHVVTSPSELVSVMAVARRSGECFVVQEMIPGPIEAHRTCNLLFDADGGVVGTFTSAKIRQWPELTGTGSSGRAVVDPAMTELAVRLFSAMGARGLLYLEAKRDERDGELVLIEANVGRPTGRGALADHLGIPLLRGWYDEIVGAPRPHELPEQGDAEGMWTLIRSDVQAGFAQWRRGELGLRSWAASYRHHVLDAVWDRRDPVPFARDLTRAVRKRTTG